MDLRSLGPFAMPFGGEKPVADPNPFGLPSGGAVTYEVPDLGASDLALDFKRPSDALSPWNLAIAERLGASSETRRTQDDVMRRVLAGETVERQDEAAKAAAMAAKVDQKLVQTAHMPDEEFDRWAQELKASIAQPAQLPARPELEAPNHLQLGIAALGALLSPQNAFDVVAAPFAYQLGERERQDQRNLQQFQLDQQQRAKVNEALQILMDAQNRRDMTWAQLEDNALQREVTMRGQDEASLRAATNDLNAGAPTVAQAEANLAQLEATFARLGKPLPEGWEATKAAIRQAAATKEKDAADAKQRAEDFKSVQKFLNDAGDETRIPSSRASDVAMAKSLLIKWYDETNPTHLAVMNHLNALERVVGRPSQKQQDDARAAQDKHQLDKARLISLSTEQRQKMASAKLTEAKIAIFDREFQARMIESAWRVRNIQSTIARRKLDGVNAVAKAQAGKVSDDDRKALKDESGALSKEMSVLNAQIRSLDAQFVSPNDPRRQPLNDRLSAIATRQREIGEALRYQPRPAPPTSGGKLFGISPTSDAERRILAQAQAALDAGKDPSAVRELASKMIRQARGK